MERGDAWDERGGRGQDRALVLHGNDSDSDILSPDIVAAVLAESKDHIGPKTLYHEWCSGQKTWHVCALVRPPFTCVQSNCKPYLWCTHCGGGTESAVAHYWADWLHSPCVWVVPNASERGTPSVVARKWAYWVHNPSCLGCPRCFTVGDKIGSGPLLAT